MSKNALWSGTRSGMKGKEKRVAPRVPPLHELGMMRHAEVIHRRMVETFSPPVTLDKMYEYARWVEDLRCFLDWATVHRFRVAMSALRARVAFFPTLRVPRRQCLRLGGIHEGLCADFSFVYVLVDRTRRLWLAVRYVRNGVPTVHRCANGKSYRIAVTECRVTAVDEALKPVDLAVATEAIWREAPVFLEEAGS